MTVLRRGVATLTTRIAATEGWLRIFAARLDVSCGAEPPAH